MKLYMKQKFLSFTGDSNVYAEDGSIAYKVKGKLLSIGRELHIFDGDSNRELALCKEKVLRFLPQMDVYVAGKHEASIKKALTFFRPAYKITKLGWHVKGDIFQHNYTLTDKRGQKVARIRKKFFALTDSFEFQIYEEQADPVLVLAVILAIDMVLDQQSARSNAKQPSSD